MSTADHPVDPPDQTDWAYLDEIVRRQGVEPKTLEFLRNFGNNFFESDEEIDAFLEDLYRSRRADLA